MLMAGEVEEIVVYPGAKAALIFLRPDAVYKVRNTSRWKQDGNEIVSFGLILKEVLRLDFFECKICIVVNLE